MLIFQQPNKFVKLFVPEHPAFDDNLRKLNKLLSVYGQIIILKFSDPEEFDLCFT